MFFVSIPRAIAKERGLKHYITANNPCKRGNIAMRLTANHTCLCRLCLEFKSKQLKHKKAKIKETKPLSSRPLRLNFETVLLKLYKIHGFDSISFHLFTTYLGYSEEILCFCNKCHISFSNTCAALLGGVGCPACSKEVRRQSRLQPYTTTLHKLFKRTPEHIKITNLPLELGKNLRYVNVTLTCEKHGTFTKSVHVLLSNKGGICSGCGIEANAKSRVKYTYTEALEKAKEIHGDSYTYPKVVEDFKLSVKVPITCNEHGIFLQSFCDHITRRFGCPSCLLGIQKASYTRSAYIDICKRYEGKSNLYLLFITSPLESFYKIGITKSFKERYSDLVHQLGSDYVVSTLYTVKAEAGLIWDLETKLHQIYYSSKYKTNFKFGGYTECFSNIDGILDHIPFDQVEVITDLLSQQEIAA